MRGAGEGRPLTEVDAGGSGGMIVGPRCSSWYSGPAGGTESPPTPRKIDEDRLPTPSSSSVRTIEEMAEPPKYPLKSVFLQQLAPQDAQRRGGQARPVIRRRRQSRGLSQEEFAERAGIHRTYVSQVEQGDARISLPVALCIAN